MTSTLISVQAELSRQLGDRWASTTTGAGTTATLVDSALKAKASDWVQDEAYVMLTEEPGSAAAIYDIRRATSLSTDTLTVFDFDAAPGTGIDYELHRLFHPDDKNRALVYAARASYPALHEKIRDESFVAGNWLKDGSLEVWPTSSTLTYWSKTGSVSLNQATLSPYYKHGATSCLMDTATGSFYQAIGNNDDLKRLAGKTVTFTVQGHSDTADSLRISIYDGSTLTYSDHNDADTAWTLKPLSVTARIQDNPSVIEFRIHHDVAAAADYVDDARVIGPDGARLYIGGLGLAQNMPHRVSVEQSDYNDRAPFLTLDTVEYDPENGYIRTPNVSDLRLRIEGYGYLDFLASGVSSTAWTATININSPQTDILVAQAALYLYTWMSMPNFDSGTTERFQQGMGFWQGELQRRKNLFRMPSLPITIQSPV